MHPGGKQHQCFQVLIAGKYSIGYNSNAGQCNVELSIALSLFEFLE